MKTGSCLWEEFSVQFGFESVLRSVGSLLGWAVSLLTPLSPRLLIWGWRLWGSVLAERSGCGCGDVWPPEPAVLGTSRLQLLLVVWYSASPWILNRGTLIMPTSWGCEDPLRRKWQPTPIFLPGAGTGNPLQYSGLDRGAWQATVHGVAKSWARLMTD